jgi:hypothetical protein
LNKKELIKLVLSRKKRISIDQLAHDASNSPEINFLSIVSSNKKLRGTVPPGSNIVGKFLFFFHPKLSGEAKVANFKRVVLANK